VRRRFSSRPESRGLLAALAAKTAIWDHAAARRRRRSKPRTTSGKGIPVKSTTTEAGSGTDDKVVALLAWTTELFAEPVPVISTIIRFVSAYGVTNGLTRVDRVGEPALALLPPVAGMAITAGGVPGGTVLFAVLVGEYQLWDVWVLPAFVNVYVPASDWDRLAILAAGGRVYVSWVVKIVTR